MGSLFYKMETLAEGVHAAIGRLDTTAYSNAIIVDIGDRGSPGQSSSSLRCSTGPPHRRAAPSTPCS